MKRNRNEAQASDPQEPTGEGALVQNLVDGGKEPLENEAPAHKRRSRVELFVAQAESMTVDDLYTALAALGASKPRQLRALRDAAVETVNGTSG